MPNMCDSCVECFKKFRNPDLKKTSCSDYMESFEKTLKIPEKKQEPLYVFEGGSN